MCAQLKAIVCGKIRDFRDDTRGVTAILFAAIALPLLGLGLAAIDYGRAHGSKTAIQDAADAAAHAGAKMLGAPHDEIEEAVRGFLKTNLPQDRSDLPFSLIFGPDDTSLTIKLNTSVPTTMLGIVGVKSFDVAVESTVERPAPAPVAEPPSRGGVTPELPKNVEKQLSDLGKQLSPDDQKQVEEVTRQIINEVERAGGGRELRHLMRRFGHLR